MRLILTMPQPGETINEGVIVRWLKNPGDRLQEKEPLVELETEKAVFNYESPFEGVLISHEAKEGASIPVGEPLALFEIEEAKAKGYLTLGIGRMVGGEPQKSGAPAVPAPEGRKATSSTVPAPLPIGQPLSPRLRTRARELGLAEGDVAKIHGTGPQGRVTEVDLVSFVGARPAVPQGVGPTRVKRIPVTPVRRRIAENMERSKQEIPHAAAAVEADLTELFRWRAVHAEAFQKSHGVALSFLPCFVWSVVQAIQQVPAVNASWKGDLIEVYEEIHVNLAVATPKGLFVPLLKGAGEKNFVDLALETSRLTHAAAAGTLRPDELETGTITVNNHGAVGSIRAFQVIRYPQAAIIGFGKVVDRPWVVSGQVQVRKISQLDVSFDHRIIDGDVAVRFLEEVRKSLEDFAAKSPL